VVEAGRMAALSDGLKVVIRNAVITSSW
jgi:hypothetical protein